MKTISIKTVGFLFFLSLFSLLSCSKNQDDVLAVIFKEKKITIDSLPANYSTISSAKLKIFYDVVVDPECRNLNNEQVFSEKMEVRVYELKQNVTLFQMFTSLSNNLNELCLTQSQIVNFCEKNFEYLRQDGFVTFFLFKENNEFFVAKVNVKFGRQTVFIHRLDYNHVWKSEHALRLVVPSLM